MRRGKKAKKRRKKCGVRIGEASTPGPQSNVHRVPGASQLSGVVCALFVAVLRVQATSSGEMRRRLVLSQQEVPESDHEWDSDTDSIGGASDIEGVDVVEPTPVEDPSFWTGDCGPL